MTGIDIAAVAAFGLFFVLIVLFMIYASRYQKVGPNQVLIISGRSTVYGDATTGKPLHRSFRIVRGGGTFIYPVIDRKSVV
jgi:flotillin